MVPFVLKIWTRIVSIFRRPSSFSQRFLWLQPDCNTWQQYYQLQSVEYMIEGRGKCSEYCSTFRSEDIDWRGFFLQTSHHRTFHNGFYDCNQTAIHGSNIISSKASYTWSKDGVSVLNIVVPFVLKILTRVVSFFRRPSNSSHRFLWLQPDCNTWQQYYQLQSVEYMIEGRWKCSDNCSTFRSEDIDSHGFIFQTTVELSTVFYMKATKLRYVSAILSAPKRRIHNRRTG